MADNQSISAYILLQLKSAIHSATCAGIILAEVERKSQYA